MPQVTPHKLDTRNLLGLGSAAVVAVLPQEGDFVVFRAFHRLNPTISNGSSADIGSQVLDRVGSRTKGLDVDSPFLVPNHWIDTPALVFYLAAKLFSKRRLQRTDRHQELRLLHTNDLSFAIDAHSGHDVVDMEVR